MSTTTNFVSELIRAANEASNLTVFEKGRLLGRAIVTIREVKAGVVDPLAFDETLLLQAAAATIDTLPDDAVKATFLDAAGDPPDAEVRFGCEGRGHERRLRKRNHHPLSSFSPKGERHIHRRLLQVTDRGSNHSRRQATTGRCG